LAGSGETLRGIQVLDAEYERIVFAARSVSTPRFPSSTALS
jgi:hypothetical protein